MELYNKENLNLPIVKSTVKSKKKRFNEYPVHYLSLVCAFDIETSSLYVDSHKVAHMYVWMVGIEDKIFYGRTWDEFLELCSKLTGHYQLSPNKRIVIYVHNLAYEFQFIKDLFNWVEIKAGKEREPWNAVSDTGIEFRDSLILCGGSSLSHVAKNLTSHSLEKQEGFLDYELVRHSNTPLTDDELRYCEYDIHIVIAYIREQIDMYGDIKRLPNTNTGRVRELTRKACFGGNIPKTTPENMKKRSKIYRAYKEFIRCCTLSSETYTIMKNAYSGGYTHSNFLYTKRELENVYSVDLSSSYPSVMISEKFPRGRFVPFSIESMEHLNEMCDMYCVVFRCTLGNLITKASDSYISYSKCEMESTLGVVETNGRVYSADEVTIWLTDVDWDIIKRCYDFDRVEVSNSYYARKAYLPKQIVEVVLDLYADKTELKGYDDKKAEYMLAKAHINALYGMSVTDIVNPDVDYVDGEWVTTPADIDEKIEEYNNSKSRFLFYPWGVWITAYARRNLWEGILAIEDDYVYSDTDSLKMFNYEKHKESLDTRDDIIKRKMVDMCEYYGIDTKRLHPRDKWIGVWEYEGMYERFKTLGAKRYIGTKNGKFETTIAGLGKREGAEYMLNTGNPFEFFDDNMYIPAEHTGKLTHTYLDEPMEYWCQDYQGNWEYVRSPSAVHLEPASFELVMGREWLIFLDDPRFDPLRSLAGDIAA